MAKRKALGKKTRFDVFKRDSFTCQYCGGSPPTKVLEVDHINPVSKGGANDIDNLITACFDCNRGKAAGELTDIPETLIQKKEVMEEHEEQIKEYNKLLRSKRRRQNKTLKLIDEAFQETYSDMYLKQHFLETIRTQFMPYISEDDLISAMFKATSIARGDDGAIKYFCGICWRIIRSIEA